MTVGKDPATVAVGAGTLYVAPIGTAEPASITAPWIAAWIQLGYTETGTIFTSGSTTALVEVAEEYYPLSTIVIGKTSMVDFKLAQMTAYNMQVAMNGGTIAVVGGGGGVTFVPPAPGTEVRVMLGWQSLDNTERYIWRQCFQTAATARNLQKSVPAASLNCSFNLEKPIGVQPWIWLGTAARSGS
jgi:hypothetical protein